MIRSRPTPVFKLSKAGLSSDRSTIIFGFRKVTLGNLAEQPHVHGQRARKRTRGHSI